MRNMFGGMIGEIEAGVTLLLFWPMETENMCERVCPLSTDQPVSPITNITVTNKSK